MSKPPAKSPLYTKSGDKGQTGLFGGKRIPKTHPRLAAYGSVDELQALLGVISTFTVNKKTKAILTFIMMDLFHVEATLASEKKISGMREVSEADVAALEKHIDELDARLPKLKNFVLPGGRKTGALLHLARTVCRRAERETVALAQKHNVSPSVLQYLNRLSDLLFVMARFENRKSEETLWRPRK